MAAVYEYFGGTVKTVLASGDQTPLGLGQAEAVAVFSSVSRMLSDLGAPHTLELHYRLEQDLLNTCLKVEVREHPERELLATMRLEMTEELYRYCHLNK